MGFGRSKAKLLNEQESYFQWRCGCGEPKRIVEFLKDPKN